jgi:dTDP-4-dehydrorhamnose reductase
MTPPPLRVLVTGRSGLVGAALDRLVAARYRDRIQLSGFSLEDGDIADEGAVWRAFSRVAPDVVVHAAACAVVNHCQDHPGSAWATNVLGSLHVARAARRLGCRAIYLSSDYIFDGQSTPETGYDEEAVPRPLNFYGLTKLAGEGPFRVLPGALVVRTAWLFGGGTAENSFVAEVVQALRAGRVHRSVADQYGSPTSAHDLAEVLVRLCVDPGEGGEVLNVVNRGRASFLSLAQACAEQLGLDQRLVQPIPRDEAHRGQRPLDSTLDPSQVERRLGLVMRPWREALRQEIAAAAVG